MLNRSNHLYNIVGYALLSIFMLIICFIFLGAASTKKELQQQCLNGGGTKQTCQKTLD